MRPIYLDHNATTPIDPQVAAMMRPLLEDRFGNPSSAHAYGREARDLVEQARAQVASLLRCAPEEVIFTSGGSESNNLAIKGAMRARRDRGNHIITSAVDHPAVSEVCRFLEGEGCRVTVVGVDGHGLVDVDEVARAITAETVLISIMHANNEVGTIQPIAEIAAIARERDVLLHTDAAQSAGKIDVGVDRLRVDLLTLAGHKVYAPKGVGALYVRGGVRIEKLIHGADHERGLRAGTENVLEIVGLGKACELAARDIVDHARAMQDLRDLLHERLAAWSDLRLNGHPERRLPNTLNVSLMGTRAVDLLAATPEVAASAGAACHSSTASVSGVMAAMGIGAAQALAAVRFSVGRFTTREEIERAAAAILEAATRQTGEAAAGHE